MIKQLAMGILLLTSTVGAKAENVPMFVEILPDFGLSPDMSRFVFLPITGGNATSASVGLNVSSNKGTSWSLQVSGTQFETSGESTVFTIPRESVTYRVLGGQGTRIPEETSAELPFEPTTIYTSSESEMDTDGTLVTLTVNINPPKSQKPGKYNADLTVMLVDNF